MSDAFKNAVRPFTGALHRLNYTRDGQVRAQAWYYVGAIAWSVDGELCNCSGMNRCPLLATLSAIQQALRHMRRRSRTARRVAERKGGAV